MVYAARMSLSYFFKGKCEENVYLIGLDENNIWLGQTNTIS